MEILCSVLNNFLRRIINRAKVAALTRETQQKKDGKNNRKNPKSKKKHKMMSIKSKQSMYKQA